MTRAAREAAERAVETAAGWRVLLPPGWLTLPTDPRTAPAAIDRYLDRILRGKPRDELIHVRIELDRALRRQVEQASRAGARHVHALAEPISGIPVSASLIAVPVSTGDPEELAAALSLVLGSDPNVVEHGSVDVGELPALRRVRHERVATPDQPGAPEQPCTFVDYVVPVAPDAVLILVFSTTTEQVQEALVLLFDAIATTLHRTPAA